MQAPFSTRDRQITAVICDMDNTLLDFVAAKQEACRNVVDYIGSGDPETLFRYFLRGIHGFEHHNNISDYLSTLGMNEYATLDRCCTIYEEVKLRCVEPYPGVDETLCCLSDAGIGLAVATDAELRQAERRLRKAGLHGYFSIVVTPDVSGKRKPEPDSLLYALRHLDAVPTSAMMVGDSPARDIAAGRKLGMATAFAAYGDWRDVRADDPGADIMLSAFSDLLQCPAIAERVQRTKNGY
jgi:putative hydrolase of the HAD superfamily